MLIKLFPQRMKLVFCFFYAILFVLVSSLQSDAKVTFSPLERKIIQWTDERRHTDSITLYLAHRDENVAWRAAWGLANIEDSTSRPKLISAIAKEARVPVVNGIAFAIGVLGPSKQSYNTLMSVVQKNPTEDVFRAIGRTIPKDEIPAYYSSLVKMLENGKVTSQTASISLIEISLRKMMTDDLLKLATQFLSANEPKLRWQAMYSFSRTEDSALLYEHISTIAEGLSDIGSPEVRMFAAAALGKIHNDSAGKFLLRAVRSEQEWRVKVSIFTAISKLPRFNSSISEVIKRAVVQSTVDDKLSEHVAITALTTLDAMIFAGKLSSSDSITTKEWLSTMKVSNELYTNLPNQVRGMAVLSLSRLSKEADIYQSITDILSYRQRNLIPIATQAYAAVKDTFFFKSLIMRALYTPETELFHAIEALNSNWKLAKQDTLYYNQLVQERLANAYRYFLIRVPNQFSDPASVVLSMEYVRDSTIIADSVFRSEATTYISGYIDRFLSREFSDQLQSILGAIQWLKPHNDKLVSSLQNLYRMASVEWCDKPLADSTRATLELLGSEVQQILSPCIAKSAIDWELLENSPDTILVQYAPEFMFLKLDKYNAPVTCSRMLKLIKGNYYAQNYFHRVVPNFVIQAGDPTGSGFGGPGYTRRREISNI
jgi:HEAT repeat protein